MEDIREYDDIPYIERYVGVQPYQFEPEARPDPSEYSSESDDERAGENQQVYHEGNRAGNTDWCSCGHCAAMPTEEESICCKDVQSFQNRLEEGNVKCITDHPGFGANCTNRWVLEVSFHEFVQDYGAIGDEEPVHELYRYIAYRRLARFIYFRLAKYDRRIHPACAVTAIRDAFPSQEYAGFQYP